MTNKITDSRKMNGRTTVSEASEKMKGGDVKMMKSFFEPGYRLDACLQELDGMRQKIKSLRSRGIEVSEKELDEIYAQTLQDFAKKSKLLAESMRARKGLVEILQPTFDTALKELKRSRFKRSPFFDSQEYRDVAEDVQINLVTTRKRYFGRGLYFEGPDVDFSVETYNAFGNPLKYLFAPLILPARLGSRLSSANFFRFGKSNYSVKQLKYLDSAVKRVTK